MSSRFRNRRQIKLAGILSSGLYVVAVAYFALADQIFGELDFKLLDVFHRLAVAHGRGPPESDRIVIVAITDGTYEAFDRNYLDRGQLAPVNGILGELGAEAVGYDIVFARRSDPDADRSFAQSLRELSSAYLPVGLALTDVATPFEWKAGAAFERLRTRHSGKPRELGAPRPYHGTGALVQLDLFAESVEGSGHIAVSADSDGIYRHLPMLARIDDRYVPTLSLAMFLGFTGVALERLEVAWGRHIVVPAVAGAAIDRDVVIPIDERGRAFVPYPAPWATAFSKMEVHALVRHFEDETIRGNLTEFFEGKFVLVGDVAVGAADLGPTPLEANAPLILVHAAMLNGMLTGSFYREAPPWHVLVLVTVGWLVLSSAALMRSPWYLYSAGVGCVLGLLLYGFVHFVGFLLVPVATVGLFVLLAFAGLAVGLERAIAKDQAFVKGAFAKYVPALVVAELLEKPELLKLGGEERELTVLFSDLAGFTTLSEKLTATALVGLLNEYLTEMTNLVLRHGGIIDKYEGDAIMAEFGAPLPLPGDAGRAVQAALNMQRRLEELRPGWGARSLPRLECRIGINTGRMVVGNMGSDQVFDYTVIGDAVNLASRLEGANKRYGTFLMVSEFTHRRLEPGRFRSRLLDVVRVKGKTEAVKVFEVYGETDEPLDPGWERYYGAYEEAMERYLARDFSASRERLEVALRERPGDLASTQLLDRLGELDSTDLPEDWDGSVSLTEK